MTELEQELKVIDLDDRAVAARDSESETESLITDFIPFLKSRSARYSAGYDDDMRDTLYSVAMSAFHEAIQSYDIEKGHFFPFANRVIRARIIDHFRTTKKQNITMISLDADDADDDQYSAQSAAISEVSMRKYEMDRRRESLADEIEQFKTEIAQWDLTMEALVNGSPKHKELRVTYKEIIAKVIENRDIMETIQIKRYFPITAISKITGLPLKKLERARTFVLASVIIKTGDYELLSDYIDDGRKT